MRAVNRCLVLLLCGLFTVACADGEIEGERFEGDGFSIVVPGGWHSEMGNMGEFWMGRPDDEDSREFMENLNVIVEGIPHGMNEARYLELSKDNMTNMGGLELKEEESVTINDVDGTRIRYQGDIQGMALDNDVYILADDDTAYILTLSALEGDSRDSWMSKLTAAANTFRLE